MRTTRENGVTIQYHDEVSYVFNRDVVSIMPNTTDELKYARVSVYKSNKITYTGSSAEWDLISSLNYSAIDGSIKMELNRILLSAFNTSALSRLNRMLTNSLLVFNTVNSFRFEIYYTVGVSEYLFSYTSDSIWGKKSPIQPVNRTVNQKAYVIDRGAGLGYGAMLKAGSLHYDFMLSYFNLFIPYNNLFVKERWLWERGAYNNMLSPVDDAYSIRCYQTIYTELAVSRLQVRNLSRACTIVLSFVSQNNSIVEIPLTENEYRSIDLMTNKHKPFGIHIRFKNPINNDQELDALFESLFINMFLPSKYFPEKYTDYTYTTYVPDEVVKLESPLRTANVEFEELSVSDFKHNAILKWVDLRGELQVYKMHKDKPVMQTQTAKDIISYNFDDVNRGYDDAFYRRSSQYVGKSATTQLNLSAPFVSTELYDYLSGIAISPVVEMYDIETNTWLSVDVVNSTLSAKKDLTTFEIVISIPIDQPQQL